MNYLDDIEYHWAASILIDDKNQPEMVAQIFKAIDIEDAKLYMDNLYEGSKFIFAVSKSELEARLERLCKFENLDVEVDRVQREKHNNVYQELNYSNYYHLVGESNNFKKMELIARGISPADVVESITIVHEGFIPFMINSFDRLIRIKEEMALLER